MLTIDQYYGVHRLNDSDNTFDAADYGAAIRPFVILGEGGNDTLSGNQSGDAIHGGGRQ